MCVYESRPLSGCIIIMIIMPALYDCAPVAATTAPCRCCCCCCCCNTAAGERSISANSRGIRGREKLRRGGRGGGIFFRMRRHDHCVMYMVLARVERGVGRCCCEMTVWCAFFLEVSVLFYTVCLKFYYFVFCILCFNRIYKSFHLS